MLAGAEDGQGICGKAEAGETAGGFPDVTLGTFPAGAAADVEEWVAAPEVTGSHTRGGGVEAAEREGRDGLFVGDAGGDAADGTAGGG